MLTDTSAAASRRYFELLRARTPAERGAILSGLVASVRQLALASIRAAHPHADEREVSARLASRVYGPATARRLYPDLDLTVPAEAPDLA